MKKLFPFFLVFILISLGCKKNNESKPVSNKSDTVKSVPNISKGSFQSLGTAELGVGIDIKYLGNGIYDNTITIPYYSNYTSGLYDYQIHSLTTDGYVSLGNHFRTYEFQYTYSPNQTYQFVYGHGGSAPEHGYLAWSYSFTITGKPSDPTAGWNSIYRYYNRFTGGHQYTNYWETLGSYTFDYQFEKVQGYLATISRDPYTLAPIYLIPNHSNYVAIYEYFNQLNDYVITTSAIAPTGFIYNGGALGIISNISTGQFNLPLNEYINSQTGQHVYTSPPENLTSPWAFSKVIGYMSSTPYNLIGNSPVTKSFPKDNCSVGYIASISETIPANTFYSDTQTNADAEALDYLNANGLAYAHAASVSNCVLIAPQNPSQVNFNMKNTTNSNYTLTFSGNGPNISISLPALTNSLSTMVNVGTYTLLISPAGAPTSHHISLGSRGTVMAVGTTFNNVNISPGSTDLNLVINQ